MHPEILSITLFGIVAAFTPGPNNFVAFYSGFNFGIVRTLPHIIGVTLGFPFLLLCLALGLINIFKLYPCLLYTSPSPRDISGSRMPSSA